MRVVETCAQMAAICRETQRPLGLVPTMGALHEGHLSLARQARSDNATMAASIFVNPTQFGPHEDFARYPRSLERDLEMLEAEGTDLVFVPPPDEVYPDGFDTWIEPGAVADGMEGTARPGHFRGVATVVAKLFTVTRPDRAYFGQKDGQQAAVIRQDERRPQPGRRGRHHAYHTRTGRPGAEQSQRLPDSGAARNRAGRVPRPMRGGGCLAAAVSGTRRASGEPPSTSWSARPR